jgi:dTDP-4-dehydrorhamnose reductase
MKIAVFGSTGMLGHKMLERLAATGFEPAAVPEDQVDIRDYKAVEDAIMAVRPAAVMNCAALTDVDGCETNKELAFAVNAQGAGNIARAALVVHAPVVYISTDYIFDGWKKLPYEENDTANPQGVYANSKWEGEKAVIAERGDFFIIRTSWLYGPGGKNFVDTMIRLAAEREVLTVVNDQVGSPTYTVHLAGAICRILKMYLMEGYGKPGIYHISNTGYCTWYDFAKKIVNARPGKCREVKPVTTSEFYANATRPISPRPHYSVLSNDKVKKWFGIALPHWEDALAEYLSRD